MILSSSLKKQYFFKLLTSILALVAGIISIAIVPGSLGAAAYGKFEFITNNMLFLFGIVSLSVPIAYYNWVSRKNIHQTTVATGLVIGWTFFNIALLVAGIVITLFLNWSEMIWPEIPKYLLWSGLAFASFTSFQQLFSYLSDATHLTVTLEKIKITQSIFKVGTVFALLFLGFLNLKYFIFSQILILLITSLLIVKLLINRKVLTLSILRRDTYSSELIIEFRSFVVKYVSPLLIFSIIAIFINYFDRWFLQYISGSIEQGFYGVAQKMGTLSLLFTTAMSPIIIREFASSFESKDLKRMQKLFNYIKYFLLFSAIIGAFLCVQSENIIRLMGNPEFLDAIIPISIMVIFPIHQTLGQLSGSYTLAIGKTGLYGKISLISTILGLPITYLLLAPKTYFLPGLKLGSIGLALKMVIVQIISTNIQLFYNTRYLKISYLKWVNAQFIVIVFTFPLAFLVKYFTSLMIDPLLKDLSKDLDLFVNNKIIVITVLSIITSGIIYVTLLLLFTFVFPNVIGLTRKELFNLIREKVLNR